MDSDELHSPFDIESLENINPPSLENGGGFLCAKETIGPGRTVLRLPILPTYLTQDTSARHMSFLPGFSWFSNDTPPNLLRGHFPDSIEHSCNPNLMVNAWGKLYPYLRLPYGGYQVAAAIVSTDEVLHGEPLTFDYATIYDGGPNWSQPCNCNSPDCRGVITSYKNLSFSEKKFMIMRGSVPAHLVRLHSPELLEFIHPLKKVLFNKVLAQQIKIALQFNPRFNAGDYEM